MRQELVKNEFGRNRAEQAEFERTVTIETFGGFKFGSVESYIVASNMFEKAQDEEQVKFERDEKNKKRKRTFHRKQFSEWSIPKQVLKEPILDFTEARLSFDRGHKLKMVMLEVFYSQVPQREQSRLADDGKFEREGLLKKQTEAVNWFSDKYQIKFKENWKSYSFSNDHYWINIERRPYNDSLRLTVSRRDL